MLHASQGNDESLELSSRKLANLSLEHIAEIKHLHSEVENTSLINLSESLADNDQGSLGLCN